MDRTVHVADFRHLDKGICLCWLNTVLYRPIFAGVNSRTHIRVTGVKNRHWAHCCKIVN